MAHETEDPIDVMLRSIRFSVVKVKADATYRIELAEAETQRWRARAEAAEADLARLNDAITDTLAQVKNARRSA